MSRSDELVVAMREILLKDWDPIGIVALFAAAKRKLSLTSILLPQRTSTTRTSVAW